MALLSPDDVAAIEAAIAEVEAQSAGELVVAVVGQSDRYDLPRAVCTGAWALATMLLVHLFGAPLGADFMLLAQLPLWLLYWRILGTRPLLRQLSMGVHSDRIVRKRAMQLFTAHKLYRTRDHSGLLIMISELEHRVVIYGDTGIHQHIGTAGWQAHVKTITQGVKDGHAAQAIVEVLGALGVVLAAQFAPRADDINELSNRVILESGSRDRLF